MIYLLIALIQYWWFCKINWLKTDWELVRNFFLNCLYFSSSSINSSSFFIQESLSTVWENQSCSIIKALSDFFIAFFNIIYSSVFSKFFAYHFIEVFFTVSDADFFVLYLSIILS